jgi:hypothetical protein
MKIKVAFLGLISFLFTVAAVAQGVENDDMYFNSKDRAKLNLAKASKNAEYTASVKKSKREQVEEENSNPTDSYSARNVNPEYEARTNAQSAQSDNEDYFVNNYRYNNSNNLNTWNNNFNTRYNNPWYSANYWGPSINSWNTPYYGSYYDSWGNPWANPYYRSGWSSSFSYHWGSSYNYGWGMDYGYGNPYYGYNNPYSGFGYSPWNSYNGYGYGYPMQVVVIENGNRYGPVYGKRNSRSSEMNRDSNTGSTRSTNRGVVDSGSGRPPITGGRTSTTTAPARQSDYYNRTWRSQSDQSTGSYGSGSGNSGNTRSSWESGARSRDNSGRSTYSPPSRSSGGFDSGRSSTGGGSSSGGGNSGGSSSGSRSGGRGN